jgi:chromosome segregation ATPase
MAVLATRRERAFLLRKVARAAGGPRGMQRLRETEAELAAQRERNQYLEKELASAEERLATLEQQAAEVCRAFARVPSRVVRLAYPVTPTIHPPRATLRRVDAANHVDTACGARCRMSRTWRT